MARDEASIPGSERDAQTQAAHQGDAVAATGVHVDLQIGRELEALGELDAPIGLEGVLVAQRVVGDV
jgi:hypothetical protein